VTTFAIAELRTIFLRKISEHNPQIVLDLKDELLRIYLETYLFCFEAGQPWQDERNQNQTRDTFVSYRRPRWEVLETLAYLSGQGNIILMGRCAVNKPTKRSTSGYANPNGARHYSGGPSRWMQEP
jgi:hypothetical protein